MIVCELKFDILSAMSQNSNFVKFDKDSRWLVELDDEPSISLEFAKKH